MWRRQHRPLRLSRVRDEDGHERAAGKASVAHLADSGFAPTRGSPLPRHASSILVPSGRERFHCRPEPASLWRDLIFDTERHFREHHARHQAVRFQLAQLCRQHVLGDAGDRFSQLSEPVDPLIEQPHDLELPLA